MVRKINIEYVGESNIIDVRLMPRKETNGRN